MADAAERTSPGPGPPVDDHDVVAALGRVLESSTFGAAPRSRDLLSFVVTETVAGRGHLLNERVVARLALGRPVEVDTRTDASARVQAGRTRELLSRYYAGEGRDDRLVISIPLGQYAATFTPAPRREAADRPPTGERSGRHGPVLAVVQLRPHGGGPERRIAAGVTESLVEALSRFPGLRVVGPVLPGLGRAGSEDALMAGTRTGAEFALHGGVRARDGVVRATFHLTEVGAGETVWSATLERELAAFTGFAAEDDIVAHVAGAIGDVGGVVLRGSLRSGEGDPVVVEALGRFYAFLEDLDPAAGIEAAVALQEAHERVPDDPHVLSSLAFAHAVDVLMRGAEAIASMATATELARACLALDPTSATAHNVLGIVALARGQGDTAARHAAKALELTPLHPGNAYVAGMVIGASTDWDRGISVIREVVRVNPYGPNHRRTLLAIDALLRGDAADALAEATLLDFPGHLYGPLLRSIALGELGLEVEATAELAEVTAMVPGFLADPAGVLAAAPTIPSDAAEGLAALLRRQGRR